MVRFIGAGPGAADLITVRGAELLKAADVVIYAGSLVNSDLLKLAKPGCAAYDSANMTLEEIIAIMETADRAGKSVVRLHSGDPSLYGAVREQTDALDRRGIAWDITPGVSSFCGAAAALGVGYTRPGVSQSVIITRSPGRTPVPDGESLREFAAHGVSMALFLSGGDPETVQRELLAGGYAPETPAAVVYRATWPDETVLRCALGTLAESVRRAGIRKTALILVGDFLDASGERSRLYAPDFSTDFRRGPPQTGESEKK